jgi:hypothetical protein
MWNKIISFFDSLIIHFFLLLILLFSLNWHDLNPSVPQKTVLDEEQVEAEIERLKREQAFENMTQETQDYALEQSQIDYEQFMIQEQAHLEVLRQQQEVERQALEDIKARHLNEKAALNALLREKEALLEEE